MGSFRFRGQEWKGRVRQVRRGWDRRISWAQEKRGPGLLSRGFCTPEFQERDGSKAKVCCQSKFTRAAAMQVFREFKNGRAPRLFETLRKWGAASHRNFGVQICWTFQWPRLNKTMLTAAMKPSAMTMDQKTPLECIRAGIARK